MKTSIFQSFKYLLFSLFSFGLAIGLTDFLHFVLHWPAEVAFAITLVVLVAVNFSACRFVIFKAQNQDPRWQLGRFVPQF